MLLGHPGGPYFAGKDADHWTVLKGEVEPGEDLVAVARREFAEETGHQVPDGPMIDLGKICQKSGKRVLAWAVNGDLDSETAVSNSFEMEWPPRSGGVREFPEIDRVAWFDLGEARLKIKAAQARFWIVSNGRWAMNRLSDHATTPRFGRTHDPGGPPARSDLTAWLDWGGELGPRR